MVVAAAEEVYEPREAAAAAHFLLEQVWGVSRLQLACNPGQEMEVGAAVHVDVTARGGVDTMHMGVTNQSAIPPLDAVLRDIVAGRPVQYIAGRAPFFGMWLTVREGVLIPRPETEELVEWMASELIEASEFSESSASSTKTTAASEPLRILDVGTGSGAIAIAIARRLGDVGGTARAVSITAVDISDTALAVARENAREQGVEVEFKKCDILVPDAGAMLAGSEKTVTNRAETTPKFDIIISNPPYIPHTEQAAMHRNVTEHEPHGALFVPDDDPLLFYRAIARLRAGRLFFEVHHTLGGDVCDMLRQHGYPRVELRHDLNGRDRMVRASRDD